MIRGLELNPDLLPNTEERLSQLRDDFEHAKAVCDAYTEERIMEEAKELMRHEAKLAGLYPFLRDPYRSVRDDSEYSRSMRTAFGFYENGGEFIMDPPGGPMNFEVLDVGEPGLDWILFAWDKPASGGRAFGYKLQRRISPNARWVTVGMSDEREILLLNPPANVQQQYRIVAFNAAGETPGTEVLTYTLAPKPV